MELVISPLHLEKPPWRLRNKLISKMIEPDKTILDIGCGARNFLNYYKPKKYFGIDGMPDVGADLVTDLNEDYNLLVEPGWDYAINSGMLEFVYDPEAFLDKQKHLASEFIFTWHRDKISGRMSFERIEEIIKINYKIVDIQPWGSQRVYRCLPK